MGRLRSSRRPAKTKHPEHRSHRLAFANLEDRRPMAAGALDTTFNFDGKLTTAIGSADDTGRDVAIQADGRIGVAGNSHNGTDNDFAVVRHHANSSLDTSFSGDGMATTDFGSSIDIACGVALQSDGKIVAAGRRLLDGTHVFAIARYNVDGSHDAAAASHRRPDTSVEHRDGAEKALD